jgi:hypothetical protein
MPEDSNPGFSADETESRLAYFTLPMALNYQRNSFVLWQSALETWNDPETHDVFDLSKVTNMSADDLRGKLVKYRLALQPNKHVSTWKTLCETFSTRWGSVSGLLVAADEDYIKLRDIVQIRFKKEFPYLSGPKIFNYWSYIMSSYGDVALKHREYIEIAPDTHVIKCSIRLGVISESEATTLSREKISEIWRLALQGSGIDPIDLHSPLWFWSRNGFEYVVD